MAPMAMGPRLEMVQQLIAHQVCVPEAARAYGVTAPTVRKWLGRFLAQGQAGLADASSRPTVSPRAIAPAKALAIVELRRKRLTQARIAQALGVSASTVSRVLARAGLSHLADLEPAEPVVRYEHQAPGDLLHIDIKKLGRIQRPGHRVTGNRRDTVEGAGWDFVFVAIDDHARWPSPTSPRRALPQRRPVPQGRSGLPAPGRDHACSPTMARPFAAAPSPRCAMSWASSTALPDLTAHRPMARPNASSSRPCVSGLTLTPTRTPNTEPMP
ncbi:transposase, IS481 family [Bordetella pertussis H918]|nr:transposase, IS481 family [Bordetella pertussis H918]ETH38877.1 transposase, IS481 family [Bordetella pertussis H918]ETH41268.1 transposase, IS481 family [Bordetella pertussis H918]